MFPLSPIFPTFESKSVLIFLSAAWCINKNAFAENKLRVVKVESEFFHQTVIIQSIHHFQHFCLSLYKIEEEKKEKRKRKRIVKDRKFLRQRGTSTIVNSVPKLVYPGEARRDKNPYRAEEFLRIVLHSCAGLHFLHSLPSFDETHWGGGRKTMIFSHPN